MSLVHYARQNPLFALIGVFFIGSILSIPYHGWTIPTGTESSSFEYTSSASLTGRKEKYFVRDWNLGLGFNNIRYNIEASLLQARILGRTLVLPTYIYARQCLVDDAACALFFQKVDRRIELGDQQWDDAHATGFKVPIETMLNLTRISQHYVPVITTAQFAAVHSLPLKIEDTSGSSFLKAASARVSLAQHHLTHVTIPTADYDTIPYIDTTITHSPRILRVDEIGSSYRGPRGKTEWQGEKKEVREKLKKMKQLDGHVSLSDAERLMGREFGKGLKEGLEEVGWTVAYTYRSPDDLDSSKSPTWDEEQAVDMEEVRGWLDEYGDVKEDLLYLKGEVHDGRKPGFMRFLTPEARASYSTLPTRFLRPLDPILELADDLAAEMKARCGGRRWTAAHLRRGDFVGRLVWSPDDFRVHLDRTLEKLAEGRRKLREIAERDKLAMGDLPRDDDPFFIATDETDPVHLAILREAKAVLISDLLTVEHRRRVGPSLLVQDCSAELEQSLMARSGFFVGTLKSSVPGWILNQRASLGFTREESLLYKISY